MISFLIYMHPSPLSGKPIIKKLFHSPRTLGHQTSEAEVLKTQISPNALWVLLGIKKCYIFSHGQMQRTSSLIDPFNPPLRVHVGSAARAVDCHQGYFLNYLRS